MIDDEMEHEMGNIRLLRFFMKSEIERPAERIVEDDPFS